MAMTTMPFDKNTADTQNNFVNKGDYWSAAKYNTNTFLDPLNIFGGRGNEGGGFSPAPYAPPSFDNSTFSESKPWTNQLTDPLTLKNQGAIASQYDTTALDKLRGEATAAPGTSAWEGLMNQRQDVTDQQQRDSANANAASGNSAAQSQLAASGGISGGARERLARSSALNNAEARQGVASNSASARLGIGAQAEQNRLGLLSAQPGQDLNAANYKTGIDTSNRDYATGIQNTNINNVLSAKGAKNASDQATYQAQMKDWAATQAANATSKGGGKGGGGGK